MSIVIADLGATNARFAIIRKGRMSDIYRFACDDFNSPIKMIDSFVRVYAPDAKYFLGGVPGPICNNGVKWTNRNWKLDGAEIQKKLHLKQAILMNDLQVQGNALPKLNKNEMVYLQGKKTTSNPKILVNVGTGLGACYIIKDQVFASEFGQTMMNNDETLENKVSGTGFKKLHQKLAKDKKQISGVTISENRIKGRPVAQRSYDIFCADLARALANFAVTIKATGGVYLCGGILDEKVLKKVKFAQQFTNHPKMKALLKEMPLVFIKEKDFAFIGLKTLVKKFGWS